MYNGNKFLIYSSSKKPYLHYIPYQQKINKDQQISMKKLFIGANNKGYCNFYQKVK